MLIYQQTEYGLAEAMGISRNEALSLIQLYYAKLPILARNMQAFKNFGLRNGYTMSLAPFKRKRWFRYWEENRRHVDNFLSGVDNNSTLAEIGRQGVNTPIQGAGADMIKYALYLMYRQLLEEGKLDRVKFCLLVHDELVTETSADEAEEQRIRLHNCMIAAGYVIVKGFLITADTKIKNEWTK